MTRTGTETLEYLKGEGEYADRTKYPKPGILFLDLYMPGLTGFEILKWKQQAGGYEGTLFIALSNSNRVKDVSVAYELGANTFLLKPLEAAQIENLLHAYQTYWKRVATRTKPRVLLCEHDEMVCEMLRENLEENGYSVVATIDPAKAFRFAREEFFSVAIVNPHLHLISGMALVRELAQKEPKTPVVLISSHLETRRKIEGELRELGVRRILQKPFSIQEMLEALFEAKSEYQRADPTNIRADEHVA